MIHRIYSLLFSLFLVSIFLTLGIDSLAHLQSKGVFLLVLVILFIVVNGKVFLKKPSLVESFFYSFLFFQLLRFLITGVFLKTEASDRYLFDLFLWVAFIALFYLTSRYFKSRSSVMTFVWTASFAIIFMCLNVLPPLFETGKGVHQVYGQQGVFFYPFLYQIPLISSFLFGQSAHSNFIGNILSVGFFCGLGLVVYYLGLWIEQVQQKRMKIDITQLLSQIFLWIVVLGISGATILLFKSRGNILAFIIGVIFFLVLLAIKYKREGGVFISLVFAGILIVIVSLSGQWQPLVNELSSLEQEIGENKADSSLALNREGKHRALEMFKDHWLWGTGYGGYKTLSSQYSTGNFKGWESLARDKAMSHYLTMLAEEGIGAFLYFGFLIFYGFFVILKLATMPSRFLFLITLGLLSSIIMILTHAAISHSLQQVMMSSILYYLMGTVYGMCQDDFDHAR